MVYATSDPKEVRLQPKTMMETPKSMLDGHDRALLR